MYTVHGQGANLPFFLLFGQGPILVQINLQHSQAQPYGIFTRVKSEHLFSMFNVNKVNIVVTLHLYQIHS